MTLKFQKNYNKKLNCDCFTTIRLFDKTYKKGEVFNIRDSSNINYGKASIIEIKRLKIYQINDFMAHIDFGNDATALNNNLKELYPEVKNWDNQELAFILLKKQRETVEQSKLF